MKIVAWLALATLVWIALASCASVTPTTLKSGKPGYMADCHGTGRTWGDCFEKAAKQCPGGFDIDDRELTVVYTTMRTLTFSCK